MGPVIAECVGVGPARVTGHGDAKSLGSSRHRHQTPGIVGFGVDGREMPLGHEIDESATAGREIAPPADQVLERFGANPGVLEHRRLHVALAPACVAEETSEDG